MKDTNVLQFNEIVQLSNSKYNPIKEKDNMPCIELECLGQGNGQLLSILSSSEQKSIKNRFKPKDVLFGKLRPYLRKYYLPDFEGVCSTEIWVMTPKNHVCSGYLFQLIQTNRFIQACNVSSGSKMPRADWDYVQNITFEIPTLPEQQKIADFLSSVDKKIELLQTQLKLQEEYKKGMMQKLFSQQIRFKDDNGMNFPDWEITILDNVLQEVIERTIINNQYPVISSTTTGIYLQSDYFNKEIASSNNIGYKILRKDQIVFSPQNLWMGNINLNTIFEIGMVSPSYRVYTIKKSYNSCFLGYWIKTQRAQFEFMLASEVGASIVRRNLNLELFLNIPISLPSLPEQQKIADFLSSLDKKIDATKQQLEKAKSWKKGLMQQLFV